MRFDEILVIASFAKFSGETFRGIEITGDEAEHLAKGVTSLLNLTGARSGATEVIENRDRRRVLSGGAAEKFCCGGEVAFSESLFSASCGRFSVTSEEKRGYE